MRSSEFPHSAPSGSICGVAGGQKRRGFSTNHPSAGGDWMLLLFFVMHKTMPREWYDERQTWASEGMENSILFIYLSTAGWG